MKKLCSNRGETLVESLAAILIVALVMVFLSVAIATASKVNAGVRAARGDSVTFSYTDAQQADAPATITVSSADGFDTFTAEARQFESADSYIFYKK